MPHPIITQAGSLEIETLTPSTETIVETLFATLRSSVPGHLSTARALAALAIVDSKACLDALCDPKAGLARLVSATELSASISTALAGTVNNPIARMAYASCILEVYVESLVADTAVDVIEAADPSANIDAALARLLERFPVHPGLLRVAIKRTQTTTDRELLDSLLTRLGQADRSPATVSLVHRLRDATLSARNGDVRIGMLSSFTIDQLVPYVDLACRKLGLRPDLYVSPFNSWTRDVVDDASGLRRFAPEIVFLAVSIDDLIPDLAHHLAPESLASAGMAAIERVETVVRAFVARYPGIPFVVHDFHSVFAGPLGILDGRSEPSRAQWLASINGTLAERLRAFPACYVLDIAGVVVAAGSALADNPKLRHLAALRIPPPALAAIADAYARYVAPLKGLTKKCVVLDLDNTLWGGVVGEDSKDGIRLGNTSPGSEFVEFQAFLKSLTARGILLAVNSKNNPEDALDVIRTHEAMVLRESDFSAIRINWLPKSENMISIASELNIGVDSLVFVDDNPDERERMRQILPSVFTVDMPKDPALYRKALERLPELQTLAVTTEDVGRVERYREIRQREDTKTNSESVETYLGSLEISVEIEVASAATIPRIAQLFAKTNQFNATTRRYSAADVERFASDPTHRLWTLQSRDRFGDHGLVAIALARVDEREWTIDSFLMSCRVIGYGVESALLAFACARAREAGASAIVGEFVPTAKNAPAADFYARHGFVTTDEGAITQRWHLTLASAAVSPGWIRVIDHVA